MESGLSARIYLCLAFVMLSMMASYIHCVCVAEERKALLQIKAALSELSNGVRDPLSTWVDLDTSASECCEWERIECDPTTGHITGILLGNLFMLDQVAELEERYYSKFLQGRMKFSPFLRFKELKSLDLSYNFFDDTIVSTGLDRLSSLKKLEVLNLSHSKIKTNVFPLLAGLTALKVLNLSFINPFQQQYSPAHDISTISTLENLEVLDLTGYGYYHGPFPVKELSHLTKLEKLKLGSNNLSSVPSIQVCESLKRLERLQILSLSNNNFNKSIISCLSFLPSLKNLNLTGSWALADIISTQELSSLKELQTLDLSNCLLQSITFNGIMNNMVNLYINFNFFFAHEIMSSLAAFPSLRFLSIVDAIRGGYLFIHEFPILPHLEVLILSWNYLYETARMETFTSFPNLKVLNLDGNDLTGVNCGLNGSLLGHELPHLRKLILSNNRLTEPLPLLEALSSLNRLEVLDLSYNRLNGSIPSTMKSLSSLKVVSFAVNYLYGSVSVFCELKNLVGLSLSSNMFDGNFPECFSRLPSSLELFDVSDNNFTGMVPPSMISSHTSLEFFDICWNNFEGSIKFSLFSNHTKLQYVCLGKNNKKIEVETEEPIGWTPRFQIQFLWLEDCNINRANGSVLPSFLLTQRNLEILSMGYNSMHGNFPNWLMDNNTNLKILSLRYNLFVGTFSMPSYRNHQIWSLDVSSNHMIGGIPNDINKFIPYITCLNLSYNPLGGSIPNAVGDLHLLIALDLSSNELSGEVPTRLLKNASYLNILSLSNNNLHGEIQIEDISMARYGRLHLDGNKFHGKIGNVSSEGSSASFLNVLDISNNFFTGSIPGWLTNNHLRILVLRNNSFVGEFPCGDAWLGFLDISENRFSGPIPSCLYQYTEYLHLRSNRFVGSIPQSFQNLTRVVTLDVGDNQLSGCIPNFLGELSSIRILVLRKNNFVGAIPKELCLLPNLTVLDLSSNLLSGTIPRCLRITDGPRYEPFVYLDGISTNQSLYRFTIVLDQFIGLRDRTIEAVDQTPATSRGQSVIFMGGILDTVSALDLSCNNLTGDIPKEKGFFTGIRILNISHNRLTGPIPLELPNSASKLESLDLSWNSLTGNVPGELIKLTKIAVFNASVNNLSGRLPDWQDTQGQSGLFNKESYIGNPLLCGRPLENECIEVTHSFEEGNDYKWYKMDMRWLLIYFCSALGITIIVFVVIICYFKWRRRFC